MDVFGGEWVDHAHRLKKNWLEKVSADDAVIICGDISWGLRLEEAEADFNWLRQLPGRKFIFKGNHDLWWSTVRKMTQFLEAHEIHSIEFLFNNCFVYGDTGICGTRGWFFEEDFKESHDEKIFRRELIRLETSLKAAKQQNVSEIICFLHYPPIYTKFRCGEILDLLKAYGVSRCVYGHLHSDSLRYAVTGQQEGIEFTLTSGDFIDFTPILLKK